MSSVQCQSGDITGFPLRLAYPLTSEWPATKNSMSQLQKLIAPTDFSVNWGPPTKSAQISVSQTLAANGLPGKFQIRGIDTITANTTLAYGNANYICSSVLSIVQNQHVNLNQDLTALYELVLAFQIGNKSDNPISPDIILLTRPIIFSNNNTSSQFLSAVDSAAAATSKSITTPLDLSTIFGYNSTTLMPMVSYQTCLPVKLTNTNVSPYSTMIGSLRMRVNVVMQPLYVNASENGLGFCSSISKYTLVTEPRNLVDIFLYNFNNPVFGGVNANVFIQFKDGFNSDGFPTPLQASSKTNYLVPLGQSSSVSAFSDLLQKIEILIPETFLGKSLAEIANSKTPPPSATKKKAFKCYTIDPSRDIVGDQIMVDPTTGKSLVDTMQKQAQDAAGGDAIMQTKYYTMYGDKITGTIRVLNTFPVSDKSDETAFIAQDGARVRIVYANLSDPTTTISSLSYLGDYSTIKSNEDIRNKLINSTPKDDYQQATDVNEVKINVITVNSLADSATSGILPGDIEQALVIICIIVCSILLFAYLGFISFKVFTNPDHEPFPYFHIVMFCVLLICLSLFGVYVEKPLKDSES